MEVRTLILLLLYSCLSSCGMFSGPDAKLQVENDKLKTALAKAQAIPANASTLRIIYESNVPDPPPVGTLEGFMKSVPKAGNTLSGVIKDVQDIPLSVPITKK